MSTFGINPSYFPAQKKLEAQKSETWFKECVDTGVGVCQWGQNNVRTSSVRTTRKNKLVNYNLRNDIVDPTEVERVVNPYKIQNEDFPNNYKNYPLINPAINLLSGEERKRIFSPMVSVINSDAVTNKIQQIDERFTEFAMQKIVSREFDEEKIKKEIEEFDKWRKYTFKDKKERMGNQVLKYLYHTQDLSEEFSRGFEDLLIGAEEIYVIEIVGGEPIMRKGNPLNFYTLRSGSSWKTEDSDIIVEDVFMPIGRVIDRYHEYLSSKQIQFLENGHNTQSSSGSSMFSNQLSTGIDINSIIPDVEVVEDWNATVGQYNGAFDPEGNVRVTRVLWRGMRKIGIITKFDEFGDIVKDLVPEQYVPSKELGEEVKWEWISEWYEGTRIATNIYVKMQPCEIQMRHRDNPSICSPGIVGTVFNINSNVGRSLVDEARDLQYLFNLFMYRLELAFTKYKGKIGKLPLHLIPDGWTVDKWLYYAEYLGWAVVDAFNESQKASFRGKPAGLMNESSPVIDLEMGNYIQNHLVMLDFIERRLDSLTGITPQRKGAIDNRETVGGVERSVMQSSHITEKWFSVHDNTRKRALRALLEAAKIAWKDRSFVREFVLDTGTREILEFEYNEFIEATYGVDVTNSSNDMQTLQALKSLGERFLQNNGSLSIIADLYRTGNVGDMQRKIETYEENLQKAEQERFQQEQQLKQEEVQATQEMEAQKAQMDYDLEIEKMDREDMNKQLDRESKIQLETIKALGFAKDTDVNENSIPDVLEQEKLALESVRTSYDQSIKDRELKLKKEQVDSDTKLKEKELAIKEKELQIKKKDSENKVKIARMNKNKHDVKK